MTRRVAWLGLGVYMALHVCGVYMACGMLYIGRKVQRVRVRVRVRIRVRVRVRVSVRG